MLTAIVGAILARCNYSLQSLLSSGNSRVISEVAAALQAGHSNATATAGGHCLT